MSEAVTREDFIRRLGKIVVWKRAGKCAPHKPLLLLWALGRIHQGAARLARYDGEVHPALSKLLKRFGTPRSSASSQYPFWYLPNDGLWEIPGREELQGGKGKGPLVSELRDRAVRGGFPEPMYALLCEDPELVLLAARKLLERHFTDSMYLDICTEVGLPWVGESSERRRDPKFRGKVLIAYEHRCAICNYDVRLDDELVGIDAAHIHWHGYGGPDEVPNGLALCSQHHKAFDLGAIGLEQDVLGIFRVRVSRNTHGQSRAFQELIAFSDAKLRPPQAEEFSPDPVRVAWHWENRFRGSPRS